MSFLEVDNKSDGENNLMYVKHDNRAGKGFFNGETDVSDVNFVADFENCKIGWGKYENGTYFKEWQDNIATKRPDQDQLIANGYKRAFSLYLFSNDVGLKLWERDSAMEWNGFLDVAKAYEREKDNRQGKLPVIAYESAEKITTKNGAFYKPVFKIKGWVDKPKELNATDLTATENEESVGLTEDDIPF